MRYAHILLVAACLMAAGPASACRFARPPAIPVHGDYDAVAIGTVTGGDEYGVVVRLDEMIAGRPEGATALLEYGSRAAGIIITCGLPGPHVGAGARVVIVFRRLQSVRTVSGWVALDDAVRLDEFFALYTRETSPAAKEALRLRWHLVNRYGGPVPLTDPAQWLPRHAGGLGWAARPRGLSYVRFRVDEAGRITNCDNYGGDPPDPREGTICARIAGRRFLPPLLERERAGVFRVRWAD